ncbi:MAG: FG-GAP repeat protein, partial [Candidatus Thorarchaeota archaeon]
MKNDERNNLIKQAIESGAISNDDWFEQDKLLASDGAANDRFGLSVSIDGDYAIIGASDDDDNGDGSGSAYVFIRSGTAWTEQAKLLASDGAADDRFGFSVSIDGDYAIIGAYRNDDNGETSGSAYVFTRSGTDWTEQVKLLPSDGAADDWFGYSVSISGDYAIIGALYDDDNGDYSGSAYVFKRSGTDWTEQAKLLPSDGAQGEYFGGSVSIDGDYAIIGAYRDDDNGDYSGSAYVFTRSGTDWTEQAKLLPSDGAQGEYFGFSVSIDGEYVIVGAWRDDDNGDASGSAYVFIRSGAAWTQQAKLLASDGTTDDRFGLSVSIDGDYVIVGAWRDKNEWYASGSAYVFTRSGTDWTEQAKLLASYRAAGDRFGYSVSIDGGYAIIGAYLDDDNGETSGSAYVFIRSGSDWTQQAKLLPSDGAASDSFGDSVSISGDYAIIGAYGDDDNGGSSGSAYVFIRSGTDWTEQAKLLASDGATYDYFGGSVSIDGDYAIIGAYRDDDNGKNSGSAYVFIRSGTDWTEQAKLIASDGDASDRFGGSVSISGDYAIVGARSDDDNGDYSGSAYVFIRSGTAWTQQAKLLASDGATEDYFGYSVSIDGDYAIIGADGDDDNGDYSGSAYVFIRSGTDWTEQAKLLPSDGAASDSFGDSVSISGDYAIIGADGDDDNGGHSGSAYVFIRSGTDWTEQAKLLASDGAYWDRFGWSVSIDGDYAIIGAFDDDDNGDDSGSAYVFTTEEAPVFLLGTITNLNVTENYKTFNAKFLLHLSFKPFTFNIYRDYEEIMISNDYFGFVGQGFIIGRFHTD